ncbi:hypothetical protein [Streptomyces sp. NPDC050704]|uniref:hypothetical protein n=1 Tax=Streptomyces sp. NPDC050704 TaxID=3157219 RepID=UPI00343BA458
MHAGFGRYRVESQDEVDNQPHTLRHRTQRKVGRSQWNVEDRLHRVRDTGFAENASTVRTRHGRNNIDPPP